MKKSNPQSPRRFLVSLLALILAATATIVAAEEPQRQVPQKFGNGALKGTWAFTIEGTVFLPDPVSGASIPVPFSALGVMTADGNGNFPEAVRTLDLGGQIFHQTAMGTYQVNPDGTGISDFKVFDRDTGVLISEESFELVVASDRNEFFAMATANRNFALDPAGVDLPTVTQITVKRQWSRK